MYEDEYIRCPEFSGDLTGMGTCCRAEMEQYFRGKSGKTPIVDLDCFPEDRANLLEFSPFNSMGITAIFELLDQTDITFKHPGTSGSRCPFLNKEALNIREQPRLEGKLP